MQKVEKIFDFWYRDRLRARKVKSTCRYVVAWHGCKPTQLVATTNTTASAATIVSRPVYRQTEVPPRLRRSLRGEDIIEETAEQMHPHAALFDH